MTLFLRRVSAGIKLRTVQHYFIVNVTGLLEMVYFIIILVIIGGGGGGGGVVSKHLWALKSKSS